MINIIPFKTWREYRLDELIENDDLIDCVYCNGTGHYDCDMCDSTGSVEPSEQTYHPPIKDYINNTALFIQKWCSYTGQDFLIEMGLFIKTVKR